jgi:branched-chain amino acid transport system permease protein
MIGAYTTYWLFTEFSISPLLSHVLVLVLFSIAGAVSYILAFRRLTEQGVSEKTEVASLLIFFSIILVAQNFIILRFTSTYQGYAFMMQSVNIFGVNIAANKLVLIAFGLLALLAIHLLLSTKNLGLAMKATIQNRTAAQLVGIDVRLIDLITVSLSLGLAAFAGSLLSMTFNFEPFIGLYYTISALIVMVIGGVGNISGTLIGGMALGLVNAAGSYYFSPGVAVAISYGIFFAILLVRPRGLFRGIL